MTAEILVAIQGVYSFAIAMGITTGGILGFAILLLRHRRSGMYNLNSDI